MNNIDIASYKSEEEKTRTIELTNMLLQSPIPKDQLLENLGLFLNSKEFSRLLFMHHLYQQILTVHGSIFELGTRWGNNLSLFHACRSIYEPFIGRTRLLVGFDTFTGFPDIHKKDGHGILMKKGNVTTAPGYEVQLEKIMQIHEQENPASHLKKFELVKGDINKTLPIYLKTHPETIVALAFFDTDLYLPTKNALRLLQPRFTQGTVLGFDEAGDHGAPGVTLAIMETLGLNNIRLQHLPFVSRVSYCEIE